MCDAEGTLLEGGPPTHTVWSSERERQEDMEDREMAWITPGASSAPISGGTPVVVSQAV